ncbi:MULTISPECIES: hypothetical protein [Enterococcus]|uniref:hypothetical protein n=1 Tax=Enterococcus TaxID=1350 RepID=UPI0009BF346F|nr:MULTISPECIES: hypothetical protein [Enterococcus]MCD5001408.1 hypothetical protein [Enterococcus saccharolyticus]OQO77327.1 hypothetical protein BH745_14710 [Enterococcus gallinarum]PCD91353.1 hypothetical protein CKY18_15750 [Enterococcus gallinarum]
MDEYLIVATTCQTKIVCSLTKVIIKANSKTANPVNQTVTVLKEVVGSDFGRLFKSITFEIVSNFLSCHSFR